MIWIPDSNRGISVYKTDAVATEPIQNVAHRVRIELTTSGFGVQIATIGIPVCMCSMLGSNQLFPWLEARRTTSYAYAARCTRGRDQTCDLLDVSQLLFL